MSVVQNGSSDLSVRYQDPACLKPYARNARTHSEKQLAKLISSIKAFGFNRPVLIDLEKGILAGHARVEAAKRLGLTPTQGQRRSGAFPIPENRKAILECPLRSAPKFCASVGNGRKADADWVDSICMAARRPFQTLER